MSRTIQEVVGKYDSSKQKDQNKITLIKWLQRHPGERFDRNEVHRELGEELDVGQRSVGDYLVELEDEGVLESYGEQRISYRLEDDIVIPVKYQIQAAARHLAKIYDFARWGIAGYAVMAASIWGLLTFPFWFFSLVMLISPRQALGPIHESEIFVLTILMTAWLVIIILFTYLLTKIRSIWVSITTKS